LSSKSSPHRRWAAAGWIVGWLALAAGCSSPPRVVVHTFETAPQGWQELASTAPVTLPVEDNHLDLSGSQALLLPEAFGPARGSVDLALLGGRSSRGFAGLFVGLADPDGNLRAGNGSTGGLACVAIRANGEVRVYSSDDPQRPLGGAGWSEGAIDALAGFHRLGFEWRQGTITFTVDGEVLDRETLGPADPASRLRVGLVTSDVDCRWNNLVIGEVAAGHFDPAAHSDWGGTAVADRLAAAFQREAEAFRRRPSRQGALTLVASLEGALEAASGAGDTTRADEFRAAAAGALSELREPARRLGDETLLTEPIGRLARADRSAILGADDTDWVGRARKAEAAGRLGDAMIYFACALEAGGSPDAADDLRRLRERHGALTYSLSVDESRAETTALLSLKHFRSRVQEAWGGLTRVDSNADIDVGVVIRRARYSRDDEVARRRVPVRGTGRGDGGETARKRQELDRLEAKFQDDLRDAAACGEIVKEGNRVLGPTSRVMFQKVELRGRSYELPVDAARRLRKLASDIETREAEWEKIRSTVRYEDIQGERRTASFAARVRVAVACLGTPVVKDRELEGYRGLEQWKHDADAARGIAASAFSKDEITTAGKELRQQILDGFSDSISRSSLVAALDEARQVSFLLRVARTTRSREDAANLRWYLEQECGVRGGLRDRVASKLLE